MIFTTVLVTCLVALMGVFQQASVDTLFATLTRFDATPALSSFTATVMHLTGAITRLTLDAAPVAEVDRTLGRPLGDGVTYGGAAAYFDLDLDLPDFSAFGLSFSDISDNKDSGIVLPQPQPTWDPNCEDEDDCSQLPSAGVWSRLTLGDVGWWAYRFGVLCLATVIVLVADSPEYKRAFTDEVHPLFRTLKQQYDLALNDLAPLYQQHNNDSSVPLQIEHIPDKPPASESTYCPPSLSTESNLANPAADAQTPQTRSRPSTVFGHARCPGPFTPPHEDEDDDDAEADAAYDAYLCRALNIARDVSGEPPSEGWYRYDDEPAVTGHDAGRVDTRTPLDALAGFTLEHVVPVDAG
ncbi:hypothetical protein FKP32DRAFT_1680663 [Trametes sanguinea]|nr:hypothetical protein FKP32DRAFT_1680663 [Trametes sanguinea]